MDQFSFYKYLGRTLAFFDRATAQVSSAPKLNPLLVLYQMEVSPFCKRVVRRLSSAKRGMEIRDVLESETFYQELILGGKVDQVPCLRIRAHDNSKPSEDRWLYESKEIIKFLNL